MHIDNIIVQAAWAAAVHEAARSPRERWSAIHLSDLRARLARRARR
jgi:hypothetical protein